MFGVGWTEMLLIGIVALVVIGPKDLPVVMHKLGKAVSAIRRMGNEFQRELNKTTGLDQITDLRRSITEPLKQTAAELTREFNRPTASGAVEPTGILQPTDPQVEDVTAAIHEQLGISPAPSTPLTPPVVPATPVAPPPAAPAAAPTAPVASSVAHKAVESPAPIEATPPVVAPAPKPRKPRAKKVDAAPTPLLDAPPAESVDVAPKPPRKRRSPQPRTET